MTCRRLQRTTEPLPFTVGQNIFEIDYGSPFDPEDVVLRVIPEPGVPRSLARSRRFSAAYADVFHE